MIILMTLYETQEFATLFFQFYCSPSNVYMEIWQETKVQHLKVSSTWSSCCTNGNFNMSREEEWTKYFKKNLTNRATWVSERSIVPYFLSSLTDYNAKKMEPNTARTTLIWHKNILSVREAIRFHMSIKLKPSWM